MIGIIGAVVTVCICMAVSAGITHVFGAIFPNAPQPLAVSICGLVLPMLLLLLAADWAFDPRAAPPHSDLPEIGAFGLIVTAVVAVPFCLVASASTLKAARRRQSKRRDEA